MLMETNEHEDETTAGLDFDDKTSWLYLFKDYWMELKEKLSLTLEELSWARAPGKGCNLCPQHEKPLDSLGDASDDLGGSSSNPSGCHRASVSSSKKAKKRSRKATNKEDPVKEVQVEGTSSSEDPEWASKELLEFVAHMKDGDRSVLPQFDVRTLILQYIRQNNLRDPHNRGQIVCDSRLLNLFGKSRIGHVEMLKLIESHFLPKGASPLAIDDNQGGVVDPEPSLMEGYSDASTKIALYMRRKSCRRVEVKNPAHLDDFAAINVHNISFLYLRRDLVDDLLNEIDTFNENVVGSFVRIRISSLGQKDLHQLVRVVGTGKTAEKYNTGKSATDITLEVLNLDKREYITIDIISNQDFTEEECKRLRQSVKCELIDGPTVGQVQEKAMALQNVRVNDWLESEKLRLVHLRDRASEKGHRKELRECVEKLKILNTPEERIRRLNEVPDIHADPHMDPDYESSEDDLDSKKHDVYNRQPESQLLGRGELSAGKTASASLKDLVTWDSNRSAPNDGLQFYPVMDDKTNAAGTTSDIQNNNWSAVKPSQLSTVPLETTSGPFSATVLPSSTTSETEKIWNYKDPSCKIQGPFSLIQLRKWNTSGFFPANLRIWRTSEKQDDSILLSDALIGKFRKDLALDEPQHNNTQPTNSASMVDCRVNNLDGGWRGNNNGQLAAGPSAMGSNSLPKADRTGVVNPMDGRFAASSSDCESSKEGYVGPGQQLGHGGHGTNAFSRNSSHYPSYQGRDDRGNSGRWNGGRGRLNNWNANRQRRFQYNDRGYDRQHPHRSSSGQQFSGEQCKNQPDSQQFPREQWKNQPASLQFSGGQWKNLPQNGSSNQLGKSFLNVPAPIPILNNIDWTSLQGALSKILPPASSAHLMSSGQVQQSPVQTNVSNNIPPTLYSVGGWPPSSGPTATSIQVQEQVHVLSNLQVSNQQNKPSGGDVQAVHSQLSEVSVPSLVPCHKLDSKERCPEACDGLAAESNTKSVNGGKMDIFSGAPTTSGFSGLHVASVLEQRLDASTNSQLQHGAQFLVPVSAQQQGPGGSGVNPAPLNMGWGVAGQNPNLGAGTTQVLGNMVYGSTVQGTNMGWGMVAPGVMNMAWATPANLNMVWAAHAQAIQNANLGMAVPALGNANVNLAQVPAALGNTNPITRVGVPVQVNSTLNSGWVAPALGNTNQNPGWVGPIAGNANQSAIWGMATQGTMSNMDTAWVPSGGHPNSMNTQS